MGNAQVGGGPCSGEGVGAGASLITGLGLYIAEWDDEYRSGYQGQGGA